MVVSLLLALFSPCHSVQLIQPCHSHKYIDGHQVVVYLKEKREKRERKRVWQLISCRRLQKNEKKKKLERERERERKRERGGVWVLYSVITTYGSYLRGESRPDHSRQSHSYQENEGISRPSGASVSFFVRSQQKAAEERKKKKKKDPNT